MKVLVCGGAGYIGSHMLKVLDGAGHEVLCFDNLVHGFRDAVLWGEFSEGDLLDPVALESVFAAHDFDAVMHFSGLTVVPESVAEPALYYQNNVVGTLNLLQTMAQHGVTKFIFSSTAAVYGEPERVPIDEAHPVRPLNPYGMSKLMVENILADYAQAYDLRSIAFRYFNAAGADPDCQVGERHQPETHLIPNILKAASNSAGKPMQIFGGDYDTVDGTCMRDYVHVMDIAQAHLLGLDFLTSNTGAHCFNLGNGQGFSNLQVIAAMEQVTGAKVPYEFGPRRAGDSPTLVADSARARDDLGWRPGFNTLENIVLTAWNWRKHRYGE